MDFQGGSTPEGIPTPMDISHSSGSAFQLIIYFQKAPYAMIIWKTLLISLLVFPNEALFGQPPQTVLDIIDRLLFYPKVYKFAFVAYMKDEAYTFNQPTGMV
ncbi:MAG TPA: hypothetical protein VK658_05755 [Chryseolinea sp.]|nr:hypothetical protein [Chryseolinea sp.]